jgi:hypothetical protein
MLLTSSRASNFQDTAHPLFKNNMTPGSQMLRLPTLLQRVQAMVFSWALEAIGGCQDLPSTWYCGSSEM